MAGREQSRRLGGGAIGVALPGRIESMNSVIVIERPPAIVRGIAA